MTKSFLARGMLAGLIAGMCAVAFAKAVAEPQIAKAERFERQAQILAGTPVERPPVSRVVQDTLGLGVGVAVAGVALGGLFGLAFAAVYRRLGPAGAQTTALSLATSAFVAIFLIPFLKYPANPPSVGNADTIGRRTATYFLLMSIGILSGALALTARRLLASRLGVWNASLLGAAAMIAVVATAYVTMPSFNEVPVGFPASVLWQFRLASAGTQVTLWATLGVVFGHFTLRSEAKSAASR